MTSRVTTLLYKQLTLLTLSSTSS